MTDTGEQTQRRTLTWDGCLNVRDLGGLPTATGGRTRHRAVVRADNLDRLTAEGWEALRAYGIRTVIDLRNADEYKPLLPLPFGLDLVRIPLDELVEPGLVAALGRAGRHPALAASLPRRVPGRDRRDHRRRRPGPARRGGRALRCGP